VTLGLIAALGGCGGVPTNRMLTSVNQPVVSHNSYSLDVITGSGRPVQCRIETRVGLV
jgi:pilus assembly protein CpaD